MKTILIVGAYGFIGSNMLKYIDNHLLPYIVITFDRFEKHPHGEHFNCISKSYAGDFSDNSLIRRIFSENHIDIVIHALSSTVPITSQSASFDIESNLLPTVRLMDTMNEFAVRELVFISSGGAIYGDSLLERRETDDAYPKSSYGVVKLAIEKYLFLYADNFQLRPLVLRLSNPYGRFHTSTKQGIVNIALRAAQSGETFEVWGDGNATKDYIYVDDFCTILFALMNQHISCEVINVGSGQLYSVNDILSEIKKLYPEFTWVYKPANQVDVQQVHLNLDKLHSFVPIDCVDLHTVLPLLLKK